MPALSIASRQALTSGDWRELQDASSGKTYYFNKKLNKTVWDLDKEMTTPGGNTSSSPGTTTTTSTNGASSPKGSAAANSSVSQSSSSSVGTKPSDFSALARSLVDRGVWHSREQSIGADQSSSKITFYQHAETGETTRDLALYLEVQAAVNEPLMNDDDAITVVNAASASSSQEERRDKQGQRIDAIDVVNVDEWVALFLGRNSSGDQDAAARRLLHRLLQRSGQWDHIMNVEKRLVDVQEERDQLRQQVDKQNALLKEQGEELEQLRQALYFGVGNITMPARNLPKVPSSAALHNNAHRPTTNQSEQDDPRIRTLESLVSELQQKNRALQEELDAAKRGVHTAAACPQCSQADPWKRLLANAHRGAGDDTDEQHAAAGINRPSKKTAASASLHGMDKLPSHLAYPNLVRHKRAGGNDVGMSSTARQQLVENNANTSSSSYYTPSPAVNDQLLYARTVDLPLSNQLYKPSLKR